MSLSSRIPVGFQATLFRLISRFRSRKRLPVLTQHTYSVGLIHRRCWPTSYLLLTDQVISCSFAEDAVPLGAVLRVGRAYPQSEVCPLHTPSPKNDECNCRCRWSGLKLASFDEKRAITRKRYKIDG